MLITRLWIGLELVFVLVAAHASTPADQGQERSAGSPLLMSRSIDLPPAQATWCKSSGLDASQRDGCVTAMRVLRLMSDEPRDKKWADAMEAYLQSAVNSLDSTRVTSRNIQCRLSWCVVEVGATGGPTAVSALLLNAVQARSIKLFERTILFAPGAAPIWTGHSRLDRS